MDLGRQMVLLFTRFFQLHILVVMLTKFASSVYQSDALGLLKRRQTQYEIDLKTLLPGWDYYRAGNGYLRGALRINGTHLPGEKRVHCKHKRNVCVDTAKVIDSYVYMKGKYCMNVKHCNSVKFISMTFQLFVPLPWHTLHINISHIYPGFYKPSKTPIHCLPVADKYIHLRKSGILKIDRKLLTSMTSQSSSMKLPCRLYHNIGDHGDLGSSSLIISFEQFLLNPRRGRRSAPTAPMMSPLARSFNTQRRSISSNIFDKWQYYIEVKENAPIGKIIFQLNATDGNEKYEFTRNKNGNTKNEKFFNVDAKTGEISIKSPLDRESGTTQFTMDITARDRNDKQNFGTATVVISVADVNDNAPVFLKKAYTKTIKEDQPTGRYVLTVQATDKDEGINKQIRYYLVPDGEVCPFKVHKFSGVVTNTQVSHILPQKFICDSFFQLAVCEK